MTTRNPGPRCITVSIRSIERWLGDVSATLPHPVPEAESGKHVAVVGAGPAGMAAAFYLRRTGHMVTVFDRREHAGGILRYGIPEYRLPTSIVEAEVTRLADMGVEFRLRLALGIDLTLEDLEAAYAAVFVARAQARYGLRSIALGVPTM